MEESSPIKTFFQFLFYTAILCAIGLLIWQNDDTQAKLNDLARASSERDKQMLELVERMRRLKGGVVAGGPEEGSDDFLKEGGEIRIAYGNDPDTIDPITASDTTSDDFRTWICEYLAFRRVQEPDKFEAALAESWDVSEDGKVVTVKLRKDRRWHAVKVGEHTFPAKPFDADDVIFTWTLVKNEQVKADHLRPYLDLLERFEKVDAHTVRWYWKEPYFKALETVLFLFHIAPKHFYTADRDGKPLPGSEDVTSAVFAKQFNEHWSNKEFLCGTGPMILEKYDRQEGELVKRVNREYSGTRPYLERMRFIRVPDQNTRYNKLIAGEIDNMAVPARMYENQLKKEAKFEDGKIEVVLYDYPVYRFIGWNLRKPIFQDKTVRQALTHAVNREFIRDKTFLGHAEIQSGPFFAKGPHNSPRVEPWPFDLDRARALLKEAGWKDEDNDGVVEKRIGGEVTPFRFTMLIYSDSPDFQAVAETIQNDLRLIGVKMDINPVKWELFLEKLDNWEFDASMLGWGLDYSSDPSQLWHSSYADKKGSSNYIGWKDPRTDELIEKIKRTIREEDRIPLYHRFHEILHEEQPYTWLIFDKSIAAYDSRFEDVKYYSKGLRPCRDRREWYLPLDRRK